MIKGLISINRILQDVIPESPKTTAELKENLGEMKDSLEPMHKQVSDSLAQSCYTKRKNAKKSPTQV